MESWQCRGRQVENKKLSDAVGRISGKYVMIYPPGVPILVPGEKILKEGLPNMEFDMKDNKVHGNAGCNIFNSTVVLDDQDISSITINPAATTMMACPDMETEDAILKAMGDVKGVKAGQSENEMLLVDADGNVLMVLSKN